MSIKFTFLRVSHIIFKHNLRKMATKSDNSDISQMRTTFAGSMSKFTEDQIEKKEPFHLFDKWFKEASERPDILEPGAISFATVDKNRNPSVRYVNLKEYSSDGFIFCTSYGSRKADDIQINNSVAFSVYWAPLHRSIRVEGTAVKVDHFNNERLWNERGRSARIGVLASNQSAPIPSREYLDEIEAGLKSELRPDKPIPMPNWGGYRVIPKSIEFFQGQENRLHDRIKFIRKEDNVQLDDKVQHLGEDGWIYQRLAP